MMKEDDKEWVAELAKAEQLMVDCFNINEIDMRVGYSALLATVVGFMIALAENEADLVEGLDELKAAVIKKFRDKRKK